MRQFWKVLKNNKDEIASLAAIIQTIVVTLGIVFALYEFVLKDRDLYRARIAQTVKLSDDNRELQRSAYKLFLQARAARNVGTLQQREEDIVKINDFYIDLKNCLSANICDINVARQLFCRNAHYHSYFLWKAHRESYEKGLYAPSGDSVFKFVRNCPKFDQERKGNPSEWIEEYKSRIPSFAPSREEASSGFVSSS